MGSPLGDTAACGGSVMQTRTFCEGRLSTPNGGRAASAALAAFGQAVQKRATAVSPDFLACAASSAYVSILFIGGDISSGPLDRSPTLQMSGYSGDLFDFVKRSIFLPEQSRAGNHDVEPSVDVGVSVDRHHVVYSRKSRSLERARSSPGAWLYGDSKRRGGCRRPRPELCVGCPRKWPAVWPRWENRTMHREAVQGAEWLASPRFPRARCHARVDARRGQMHPRLQEL